MDLLFYLELNITTKTKKRGSQCLTISLSSVSTFSLHMHDPTNPLSPHFSIFPSKALLNKSYKYPCIIAKKETREDQKEYPLSPPFLSLSKYSHHHHNREPLQSNSYHHQTTSKRPLREQKGKEKTNLKAPSISSPLYISTFSSSTSLTRTSFSKTTQKHEPHRRSTKQFHDQPPGRASTTTHTSGSPSSIN